MLYVMLIGQLPLREVLRSKAAQCGIRLQASRDVMCVSFFFFFKNPISFWWLGWRARQHFLPLGQKSINCNLARASSAHTVGWQVVPGGRGQPGCL